MTLYTGNNPRKSLRKIINHLDHEMNLLQEKRGKFAREKERLILIERNDTIDQVCSTVTHFDQYNWLAFPI